MDTSTLVIDRRFAGPPTSGNGGYTAGRLAARLPDERPTAVQVTLRLPPPLAVEMSVEVVDGRARLLHDGGLVAEAQPVDVDIAPVEAVSVADASEAETEYAGLRSHPFPTCFTCGPDRAPGDGLRLFPGRVGADRTACTWAPDQTLAGQDGLAEAPIVWAALDCPGGWTADLEGRPMVLGRMTAQLDAGAMIGERHVVVGRMLSEDGRKTFTATTLYDSDERVVARAQHVWIAVDPTAFGT